MKPAEVIESLTPIKYQPVMHLLRDAGFDVRDWKKNYRGKSPAANPRFCYNWSFVQPGERVAICLWHDGLDEDGKRVYRTLGPRKPTGLDPKSEAIWKRRSDEMLDNLRLAYEQQLPITAIMLEGVQFNHAEETPKASKVRKRLLDPESWAVVSYDFGKRNCRLVRCASCRDQSRFIGRYPVLFRRGGKAPLYSSSTTRSPRASRKDHGRHGEE